MDQASQPPRKKRRVAVGHKGRSLSPTYIPKSEVRTMRFCLDGFRGLSDYPAFGSFERYLDTSSDSAHGLSWRARIKIIPGANPVSLKIVLNERPKHKVIAQVRFQSKIPGVGFQWDDSPVAVDFFDDQKRAGKCYNTTCSNLLHPEHGFMDGNTLVVDVDVQLMEEKYLWYPTIEPASTLARMLGMPETSDVVLDVIDGECQVHRCVLAVQAPALYELVKELPLQGRLELKTVQRKTFTTFLEFIYGKETIPNVDNDSDAKSLLVLADRFGCTNLKLHLESRIAESFLCKENAAELLLFADSYSCALLKELSMDVYAGDPKNVIQSDGWDMIRQSPHILEELLHHVSFKHMPSDNAHGTKGIEHLDVSGLRQELQSAGLELEGSKKQLIERLQSTKDQEDS